MLIIGLIAWSSIIYVAPIKGRLVDAEAGKPMKGVNVRAGWVTGYADPGGGSFRTFKVYATKTNENGEFVLPRTIKLKIPIIERYQGVNMLIYEHGYADLYRDTVGNVYMLGSGDKENIDENKHATNFFKFKIKALSTEQKYIKNLEELSLNFNDRTVGKDIPFMIMEYQIILQKFPFTKDAYIYHESLGWLYENYEKNYAAAIHEYKQSILKNKNSSFAPELQTKINKLQNILERERE